MQQPARAGMWAIGGVVFSLAITACEQDEALPQQGPAQHGGRAYAQRERLPAADDIIIRRIQAELASDPAIGALVIKVDSADGRIYLRGFVTSPMQKTRAAEIIRHIDGVTGIDNRLITRTRSGVPDGPLAAARLYL